MVGAGGTCLLGAGPVAVAMSGAGIIGVMTVVKIDAIAVPAGSGGELARRFAARAGAVDDQGGFEGFELLRPADGRTTWLVVTRWRDEACFQAWLRSPAFGHGHRRAAERSGGTAPPPVGVSSEPWSYEIAGGSAG
jgi:heme-degrading monooxygenase HmoA